MALVGLTVTPLLDGLGASRVNIATPGVLALCAMSTAFTGQGIATGFDRRYGVLRFLSTTPLGKAGLIAGKVLAVLAVLVIQVAVVAAVALLLGWHPAAAGILLGIALLVLGAVVLHLAGPAGGRHGPARGDAGHHQPALDPARRPGRDRDPPPTGCPPIVQDVVHFLPSGALGQAMRDAFVAASSNCCSSVLVGWTVLAGRRSHPLVQVELSS